MVENPKLKTIFSGFIINYERYKEQTDQSNKSNIWKNYFAESSILNEVQRSLLYFNLPFDQIVKPQLAPRLLFKLDDKEIQLNYSGFLNLLVNALDDARFQNNSGSSSLASLILFKIPVQVPGFDHVQGPDGSFLQPKEDIQVIGAYCSDLWSAQITGARPVSTDRTGQGHDYARTCGDETCFLFNLTQNMRFNAVKGRRPYQQVEFNATQAVAKSIQIGGQALVIDNQLINIHSQIDSIQDQDSIFVHTNCFHHLGGPNDGEQLRPDDTSKIDSIIPGKHKIEKPVAIEVYIFA